MNAATGAVTCIVSFLLHFSTPPDASAIVRYNNPSHEDSSTSSLHLRAWREIASSPALTDRLGIYASRSLAVRHPHIYLKSDLDFIREVMNIKGTARSYESDIRADMRIYMMLPSERGDGFGFELVDFDCYEVYRYGEILDIVSGAHDTGVSLDFPVLPYFDRRVLPVKSTLKLYGAEINGEAGVKPATSLELAFTRYIELRLTREYAANDLFVLYFENEESFIFDAKNSALIDHHGNKAELKEIEVSPVMILNEDESYYPLFDSDIDRLSEAMKAVVERFGGGKPELTPAEAALLPLLREGTGSAGDDSLRALFLIAASHHAIGRRVQDSSFNEKWMNIFEGYFPDANLYWRHATCLIVEILKPANLISPVTAYLAANRYLDGISAEWLYLTSTEDPQRKIFTTWGQLWFSNLTEYTIDETFRTRGGTCVTQSTNLYSILDFRHRYLNGPEPLQFQVVYMQSRRFRSFIGSHHLVMAIDRNSPFNSVVFDDGVARRLYQLFLPQKDAPAAPKLRMISYLSSPDGWSHFRFIPGGFRNWGTMNGSSVARYIETFFNFERLLETFRDGTLSIDEKKFSTAALEPDFPDGIFGVRFIPDKLRRNPSVMPVERKKLLEALGAGEQTVVDLDRME